MKNLILAIALVFSASLVACKEDSPPPPLPTPTEIPNPPPAPTATLRPSATPIPSATPLPVCDEGEILAIGGNPVRCFKCQGGRYIEITCQ